MGKGATKPGIGWAVYMIKRLWTDSACYPALNGIIAHAPPLLDQSRALAIPNEEAGSDRKAKGTPTIGSALFRHVENLALSGERGRGLCSLAERPTGQADLSSLVAVDDPPLGEVVRRHLYVDAVTGEDADEELAHLAGEQAEDLVPVLELDAELGVGEGVGDHTFELDRLLLRHRQCASAH